MTMKSSAISSRGSALVQPEGRTWFSAASTTATEKVELSHSKTRSSRREELSPNIAGSSRSLSDGRIWPKRLILSVSRTATSSMRSAVATPSAANRSWWITSGMARPSSVPISGLLPAEPMNTRETFSWWGLLESNWASTAKATKSFSGGRRHRLDFNCKAPTAWFPRTGSMSLMRW